MILGIFIHSAQVFNPNGIWLISSSSTSALMIFIIDFIHWFRMPAFFVVSGYFCYISLKKYKTSEFISLRVNRILIPFITTVLTLNIFQLYVIDTTINGTNSFNNYFTKGYFISHLWFLINILFYFFIAIVVKFLSRKFKWIRDILSFCLKFANIYFLFAFLSALEIFILSLNKFNIPIYHLILANISPYTILTYSPYFLLGIILSYDKTKMTNLSDRCLICFLLSSILIFTLHLYLEEFDSVIYSIISNYLHALSTYIITAFLFSLFFKYANRKSNISYFLADSAYTVYLFHHLLVVCFGICLIKINAPWYLGYPILIIAVTTASLFIHKYFIVKYRLLRFLFNGKLHS